RECGRRVGRRSHEHGPEIVVAGRSTRVLVEQTAAVDPSRLGSPAGQLTLDEMQQVDATLRLVMAI
ncbi:MAG: type II toxin-antitoxin system PemK/MazF family toxin, partial [Spirochaetaceae bacterium]|nr:type II toxin-antitoxin system PemK/MazF family toxin [Spirochaetaceae bacterium]